MAALFFFVIPWQFRGNSADGSGQSLTSWSTLTHQDMKTRALPLRAMQWYWDLKNRAVHDPLLTKA